MLIFIPKGSGLKIANTKIEHKDVETIDGLSNLKIFKDVFIPYKLNKEVKHRMRGNVYRLNKNPADIVFRGIKLEPSKIKIVGKTNLTIYVYMLAPLTELPILL